MIRTRLPLALLLAALAQGCAQFPALDGTVPPEAERAAFPRLVPLGPVLARAEEVQITEATEADINARVARLRARAARLRGSVVDGGTRARMRAGVTGQVERLEN